MKRKTTPLSSRFAAKWQIDIATGCWEWTARKDADGYGVINVGGKPELAHRVSYELFVGPIPAGLEIDHRCENRGCVAPYHLEPVTHQVNMSRVVWKLVPACKNGHAFTPENTRIAVRSNGKAFRACRTCGRKACADYYKSKRKNQTI